MCCWLMLFWKSLRICFFHSYQTYVSRMSLQTCLSMFAHIICFREKTVHYWAKFASLFGRASIINLCSSFTARDCNACFSQIFEKRTFGYLNEEEESLFMSLRTFDSFCSSCSNLPGLWITVFFYWVVTTYGLNQSRLDNNTRPLFVTEMHTNPRRLNCTNCNTQTSIKCLKR